MVWELALAFQKIIPLLKCIFAKLVKMNLNVFLFFLFSFSALLGNSFESNKSPHISVMNFDPEMVRFDTYLANCDAQDPECRKYLLEFHGFPLNEEISLYFKRISQEIPNNWESAGKIMIKNSGLILRNGNPAGHLFYLSSSGLLPGERLHLRFRTDKGFSYEFSLIPHPLVMRNFLKKVILEAELMTLEPATYLVKFPGIGAEKVTLQSAYKERICTFGEHSAAEPCIVNPEVEGEKGGFSKLIVTRKKGQKYTMDLPWGSKFLDYKEKSNFSKS